MAQPDNIALFNRFTLALLDHLYSSFPVPVEVDVKSIAMGALDKQADAQEAWDALAAADDAVQFLAEEGFLTHQGALLSGGTFVQVRLSLKGLAILGMPDALEVKQPLIARARSALASGSKEVANESIRQVVQQVFAAALAAGPALASAIMRQ